MCVRASVCSYPCSFVKLLVCSIVCSSKGLFVQFCVRTGVCSYKRLLVQLFAQANVCLHKHLFVYLLARASVCPYKRLRVQLLARTSACPVQVLVLIRRCSYNACACKYWFAQEFVRMTTVCSYENLLIRLFVCTIVCSHMRSGGRRGRRRDQKSVWPGGGRTRGPTFTCGCADVDGFLSGSIRQNRNDTEKMSMASAQGGKHTILRAERFELPTF